MAENGETGMSDSEIISLINSTVKSIMSDQDQIYQERFEAQKAAVSLALSNMERLDSEREKMYQQRWEAQEKGVGAALNAAEKAVSTAFIAQEKATSTAFNAQEKAVNAALTAAERAVTKAEIAAEKRFESVNEFRAQLTDQAASFMIRTEYDRSHKDMIDKIDGNNTVINAKVEAVTNNSSESRAILIANFNDKIETLTKIFSERVDIRTADLSFKIEDLRANALKAEGKNNGFSAGWGYLVGGIGVVVTVITIVIAIIGFTRGTADSATISSQTNQQTTDIINRRIDALGARLNSQKSTETPAATPSK